MLSPHYEGLLTLVPLTLHGYDNGNIVIWGMVAVPKTSSANRSLRKKLFGGMGLYYFGVCTVKSPGG